MRVSFCTVREHL